MIDMSITLCRNKKIKKGVKIYALFKYQIHRWWLINMYVKIIMTE